MKWIIYFTTGLSVGLLISCLLTMSELNDVQSKLNAAQIENKYLKQLTNVRFTAIADSIGVIKGLILSKATYLYNKSYNIEKQGKPFNPLPLRK